MEQVGNLPGTIVTGGRINANNSLQYIITNCATYSPSSGVLPHVFLEGPFDPNTGMMHDSLRVHNLVPQAEPYTALGFGNAAGGGGETTTPAVLATTGSAAVVDWVHLELHANASPFGVVATRNALLRRDGNVVKGDGTTGVFFNIAPGTYRLAVRHRNHLGAMVGTGTALGPAPVSVDLTAPATTMYGTEAEKSIGSIRALWQGNALVDGQLLYMGSGNDRDPLLTRVGGSVPTNTATGYWLEDCNLDGVVKYVGTGNDRDPILTNIGGSVPTNARVQQLP